MALLSKRSSAGLELLIRYRDGAGVVTERRISEIEAGESGYINALCHERQEGRTFKVSRIVSAVDADTGEVIEDLYDFLGVEPPPLPPSSESIPPVGPVPSGPDEIKRHRSEDRWRLFKPFKLGVIAEHARKRLFSSFGNACFKCRSPGPLVLDHHVPVVLGGRLAPGNIVVLCERCNNRKRDTTPERFYAMAELERLRPLLDGQAAIFRFEFDWPAWNADREGYLVSIGIGRELAREVLENPSHPHYISPRDESEPSVGVTITIDAETIARLTAEVIAELEAER